MPPKGARNTKPCKWCGKMFGENLYPSKFKKQNCCSAMCAAQYRDRHILERKTDYRGANWQEQRHKALERDNYKCKECGSGLCAEKQDHAVHHIIPFHEFGLDRYEEANALENLVSLCRDCHSVIPK